MAKNQTRDLAEELQKGTRDGRFMQLAPDWHLEHNPPPYERESWPTYPQVDRHSERAEVKLPGTAGDLHYQARMAGGGYVDARPCGCGH